MMVIDGGKPHSIRVACVRLPGRATLLALPLCRRLVGASNVVLLRSVIGSFQHGRCTNLSQYFSVSGYCTTIQSVKSSKYNNEFRLVTEGKLEMEVDSSYSTPVPWPATRLLKQTEVL